MGSRREWRNKVKTLLRFDATEDPPFDFAQGRLFEDDNKKGKCNDKA
jgi:hypothetical protein